MSRKGSGRIGIWRLGWGFWMKLDRRGGEVVNVVLISTCHLVTIPRFFFLLFFKRRLRENTHLPSIFLFELSAAVHSVFPICDFVERFFILLHHHHRSFPSRRRDSKFDHSSLFLPAAKSSLHTLEL